MHDGSGGGEAARRTTLVRATLTRPSALSADSYCAQGVRSSFKFQVTESKHGKETEFCAVHGGPRGCGVVHIAGDDCAYRRLQRRCRNPSG